METMWSSLVPHEREDAKPYELLGRRLSAPISLAAGLDKNGELAWLAKTLGMGFHVVGSVLPEAWPGVKPKILLRLRNATVNRLGLPSIGVERVAKKLARLQRRLDIPLAVNIAAFTVEGYAKVYRMLSGFADWFEINISCPNVEEHRSFEDPDQALKICKTLRPHTKPILLKIPPVGRDTIEHYVNVAKECGAAGIVAANTIRIRLDGIEAGLGGPPLYNIVRNIVKWIREFDEDLVVIAVGGIDDPQKILELIKLGADGVEVLSALVLKGPRHVARLADYARQVYKLLGNGGGGRKAPRLIYRGTTPRHPVRSGVTGAQGYSSHSELYKVSW